MQVMPGSSWSVVEEAKDLNPFRVRLFRYNAGLLSRRGSGADTVRIITEHAEGEAQRRSPYRPPLRRCGQPGRARRSPTDDYAAAGCSSAWAMCASWPQISTTKSAEPTKANQNGAVDAPVPGEQPADPGADDQAAEHADQVDAADPALELGRDGPLPDGDRGGAPDEGMGAEDEEDRAARPTASVVSASARWVNVSIDQADPHELAEADPPGDPAVRRASRPAHRPRRPW